MLKSRTFLCLLFALVCMAGPTTAASHPTLIPSAMDAPTFLSQAELKAILKQALAEWPVSHSYTYGTFRSAYNHGTLTIDEIWHVAEERLAYNVTYGGLTICVLLPI
jgi:hypothetical protein